ncbi:hypothetical protein KVR01_009709 [Diaporthe batatas]|uniref:uncharacterized protein n=1 Tax=Diaporthe batatas TaxID=748121 RepID=UPI001D054223|nr:uncharacterized protein KVR01_009709 [Diaporthe batatas]KAG8160173.1 hypothetical protein KVR01_009709 [Diaporthe batatas]
MSSPPPALPTPRQLLTSLLSQISRIPAPDGPDLGDDTAQNRSTAARADPFPERTGQPRANPLRLIDPRHRPLFTTLHVLFPSLLLPALDLLDRGLVTRLLAPGGTAHETHEEHELGPQARDPAGAGAPPTPAPALSVYTVRSAQKPTRRPYGGDAAAAASASAATGGSSSSNSSSSQRAYVVHTAAWNCTCAAFAFSAFPSLSGPSLLVPAEGRGEDAVPAMTTAEDDGDSAEDRDGGWKGGPWQFGGVSFDGCTDAGGVPPCCKHLLACVLAERWQTGLDRYVNRWEVTREEMAGVFADV